jgi:predicted membrane-bound mannosyltransferase
MDWLIEVHSVFRWVVLIVAVGAIILAVLSARGRREWDGTSDRMAFFFTLAMDLELLIGLALWFVESRWSSSDTVLSWLHPLAMVAAVGLAHVGRVRSDRATASADRGRQAAIFFAASLMVVLVAIPLYSWPL